MGILLQDLRYGIRLLRRNRGFTLIAVLALALGIGANSAIFSVVNALLLKPFPFENLDRLVMIQESFPNQGMKAKAVSPADYFDWQQQNSVFKNIAAYRIRDITLTGTSEPELVRGSFVSADFFSVLEKKALKGRTFFSNDVEPGRDQVVVIGNGLWQSRFASDPDILNKAIVINGRSATVVGIMPPHFDFPFGTELWIPLALTPQEKNVRDIRNLYVLGNLKKDISVEKAQAEMLTLAKRIEQQNPQTNKGLSVQVIRLRDQQVSFTLPMLSILIAMAAFLLLVACANVANLLLARATNRQKEIAIRAAFSASRWRVIRQLITESLLLSLLAGIVGLVLAYWTADLIKASLPPDIAKHMAGWKEIKVDLRVLAFTFAVSFVTTLVFSLIPALQATRLDLNEILKEGGRRSGGSLRGRRTRAFLVACEISLALVLLVGAGLMVKGFWRILNIYQGSNPENVLTLRTPLPQPKYDDDRKITGFYHQALHRIQDSPGIQSACVASNTPLNNSPNRAVEFIIEGRPPLQPGERQISDLVVISPNYFNIIGSKLLRGRDFTDSDNQDSSSVAIITELMASRYWRNEDPLGKRFKTTSDGKWITVVGIASDVKQSWFDQEIRPQFYLPYLQFPTLKMIFMARTSANPLNFVTTVRSQIYAADRNQPIDEIKTLAQVFKDEASPLRFAAFLMLIFGALALLLAAIGIYGVMSYSVAQRTHEIGVRNALGARQKDLLTLILGQGMKTALLGLAIGFPLALALSRVMARTLFGIVELEYVTLITIMSLLALVALASSYFPANRAAKIDPIAALRYE
jgi:putative ABC transport system permease protein